MVFLGYNEHWEWIMRLLSKTTKEYYDGKQNEFIELEKLVHGDGWRVMKLIREFIDKDAYLPSEYEFKFSFGYIHWFMKMLEVMKEKEYIFPKMKVLKFASQFADQTKDGQMQKALECTNDFIDFQKPP